MLVELIGQPVEIDEQVLKKHVRHAYKYYQTAANRYALRVDLKDGVVVGWERK